MKYGNEEFDLKRKLDAVMEDTEVEITRDAIYKLIKVLMNAKMDQDFIVKQIMEEYNLMQEDALYRVNEVEEGLR